MQTQLTLFPEASHVSHSVLPGSKEARQMTVTSGLRCLELSTKSGLIGLLEKMLLTSPIWNSTARYLTWKAKATKQGRLYYQLVVSMPNIKELEHSLWLTPTATDGWRAEKLNTKSLRKTKVNGNLAQQIAYQQDGPLNPEWVEWLMGFPIGWTD